MGLKFYNSLNKKKEIFIPIDKTNIGVYVCGPTVYNHIHIGNVRPLIIFDILVRLLKNQYGESSVKYVRNITDVDDKIITKAQEENKSIDEVASYYIEQFFNITNQFNLLEPNYKPKATDFIKQMQEMITTLLQKNFAYISLNEKSKAGDVMFSVEKYSNYGELSGRNVSQNLQGARVLINDNKNNPNDFVLWKLAKENEINHKLAVWQSPWGLGRPGWHIECSAMAKHYLGDIFDIHAGGVDLTFPHHENEIAQSCCANNTQKMANYWLHNGLITVNGVKMSKSLGNFILAKDLLKKYKSNVIKFAILSTHYRQNFDLNDELLEQSKKTLEKFEEILIISDKIINNGELLEGFVLALEDDLNTPQAISILHLNYHKVLNNKDVLMANRFINSLQVLGVFLEEIKEQEVSDSIMDLINSRQKAKTNKDYKTSDEIREKLLMLGVELRDNKDGSVLWKIKK